MSFTRIERDELLWKIENKFKIFMDTETSRKIHTKSKDTIYIAGTSQHDTIEYLWQQEQKSKYFDEYYAAEYILTAARGVIYHYMVKNNLKDDCEDIKLLKHEFDCLDALYKAKMDEMKYRLELKKFDLEKDLETKKVENQQAMLQEEKKKNRNIADVITVVHNYILSKDKHSHKEKHKLFSM